MLSRAIASIQRRTFLRRRKVLTTAEIQKKLSEYHAIVLSLLVELQEAQCLFLLASEIACLVAISKPRTSSFFATNLTQYQNNVFLVYFTSIIGANAPIAVLFFLVANKLGSGYICVLSILTCALSLVVAFLKYNLPSGPYKIVGPESCGFEPPPVTYIYLRRPGTDLRQNALDLGSVYFLGGIIFLVGFLGIIICSFCVTTILLLACPRFRSHVARGNEKARKEKARKEKSHNVILGSVLPLLCICMTVGAFGVFIKFNEYGDFTATDWTMGQIISLSTMAPVLCKSVHELCCKSNCLCVTVTRASS
jgi:hypothetical protein